ncbi:MAG TPA: BrnT family toxin [Casimicrobiaceae bacterium]
MALEDAFAVTVPDPDFHAEKRFVTMGADAMGRLIVVIHAARGANVRIISARLATRKERLSYEG